MHSGGKMDKDWVGNVYVDSSGNVRNTLTNAGNKTIPYFRFFADDYALFQVPYGCPEENGKPLSQRKFKLPNSNLFIVRINFLYFSQQLFGFNQDTVNLIMPHFEKLQYNYINQALDM